MRTSLAYKSLYHHLSLVLVPASLAYKSLYQHLSHTSPYTTTSRIHVLISASLACCDFYHLLSLIFIPESLSHTVLISASLAHKSLRACLWFSSAVVYSNRQRRRCWHRCRDTTLRRPDTSTYLSSYNYGTDAGINAQTSLLQQAKAACVDIFVLILLYVSSYCYICVLILLYLSSYRYIGVLILLYLSSYCYICVLMLLYVLSYS